MVALVGLLLGACSSPPEADPPAPRPSTAEGSHRAEPPDPALDVVNRTPYDVVLTSASGQNTIWVDRGASVRLSGERVCGWMPLTATTTSGRELGGYDRPCRGQTWTIRAPRR